MQRLYRRYGGLMVLLLVGWCTVATAQTRVYIDIDQVGSYLLPLVVPRLIGEATDSELGQRIRTVLRHDLERSGLFRVLDPATTIDEIPQGLDQLRYQNWSAVGAAAVIAGRLQRVAGGAQVKLELVLHDVTGQRRRFGGMEYVGSPQQVREMTHRFSDRVFREYTGETGPFNTQVVCVTPRGAGQRGKDIVLMDYDGHAVRRLIADGALNLAPTLSPDGLLLAYTSYRDGSPNIYLRHLLTDVEERLTSGTGLALPGAWSPDGRYLALSRTVDGNSDIFLYDTRHKRMQQLTTYWGIDVSPSFAPDGKRLVFTSDRSGTPQLYITDRRRSPPVRLTYKGRYNTSPVWSPRSNTIAFVGRSEDQNLAIYTIQADGNELQRLTHAGGNDESPAWAPHGRFVIYTRWHGDSWQRRLSRTNGQGDTPLPANGTACLTPQWVSRTAR
ncbi:Tol-Pal system protein TolB [Candidatus Entotheonellaceae bacterium PAL068K]